MKPIVYDLEIVKGVQGRNEARVEGIEYCEGWDDHAGMGISVLCAYDYEDGRYRVFTKDNRQEFLWLTREPRLVVGFNSMRFDQKVVEAAWGREFHVAPDYQYDILREIWIGQGLDPNSYVGRTHGPYGLNAMAGANLNRGKTGSGELAPIQWQRGEIGSVIDYCLEDVRLTRLLLNKIVTEGGLRAPRAPHKMILMRSPVMPISVEKPPVVDKPLGVGADGTCFRCGKTVVPSPDAMVWVHVDPNSPCDYDLGARP